MQITVNETEVKIENGKIIININSDIEKALGINKVCLSDVKPGCVIRDYEGIEYIVIKHLSNRTTDLWRKNLLLDNKRFDKNSNNFNGSELEEYLNTTYLDYLITQFGAENIVTREVDLTSHDGLTDYGVWTGKIALPTYLDYYYARKDGIITENMDRWWWTSTPDSTPSGTGASYVQCVRSDGDVGYSDVDWYGGGVRPFLTLQSDIFVSSVE